MIAAEIRDIYVASGWVASGLCYKVSKHTALVLSDCNINCRVINGRYYVTDKEWYRHTWIQIADKILDATCNQYPDKPMDVFFGQCPKYVPDNAVRADDDISD